MTYLRPPESAAEHTGRRPSLMNGRMDQRTMLLLFAGSSVVYVSFEHPAFATALAVGVAVVTLLHLLLKDQ